MSGNFEQAKEFFAQGLGHYQEGRFAQAEVNFIASLALLPGRVSTLTNLGAAQLKLGKPQDALDPLEEALAQEPDNVEAWGHRATALAELGRHEEALACLERALGLDGALGQAWSLRGRLLKDLGRPDEAAASFEKALAHGADQELNRYFLASLDGRDIPAAAPRHYVEGLFDGYAEQFDKHLLQALNYRAPQVLVDQLRSMRPRFAAALDLGCGTGLCGSLLKPLAGRLDGVDLSSNMIAMAQALGVYDELVQADLAHYLGTIDRRYDLVLAADVFIYVGALEAVFAGVARVMEAHGVFCFSVEPGDGGQDLALRASLRYAHSEPYLRRLAGQHGFEVAHTASHPIREDRGTPIPGLFVWLVKR